LFLTYLKWGEKLNKPVFLGNAELNIARVICAYIMHMQLYPELRASMQMLQYTIYNDDSFCQQSFFFPLMLSIMKIVGSLAAELGNTLLLTRYTSVN